ncbi:MAG: PAS domain S-box protein [Rhizobacter sp.]|nr:PAS domain S-box protein [Chlorobiales bacterium]
MDYKKIKKTLKKTLKAIEQMETIEMFMKAQSLGGGTQFQPASLQNLFSPDFTALAQIISETAGKPSLSQHTPSHTSDHLPASHLSGMGAGITEVPPPMSQEEWLRSLAGRKLTENLSGVNLNNNGHSTGNTSQAINGDDAYRQSEARLRSIIDATPLGMCITNEKGFFEYINPAYCKIYGYRSEELIGKHFTVVVPHADYKFWQDLHDKYIAGAEEVRGEWKVVHKSGRDITILADAARIVGTDGRPKKVTFVMDVSDYSRKNEELQSLTRAVESAYNAILITDANQNIVYVNQAFEKFTGFTAAEVKGKNPRVLQGTGTDKTTTARIREKLARREPISETLLNYTKDGRPYWININIRPVVNERGELTGFIGVEEDVTDRIRQTEELATLKRAVESAYNAILMTDANQNIIYVNRAFEEFTGFTAAEVIGKNPRVLQGPDTDKATTLRIREQLARREPVSETLLNYTKDGRAYWININIRPVFNERGDLVAFIGVEEDVTEKLKLSEEVRQSQMQLMQSEKMSSLGQMVAGLAHEMNTPLGFVRNNMEMLQLKHTEIKELLSLYDNLRGQIMYGSPNDVAYIMSQIDAVSQKVRSGRVYQESDQLFVNSVEGIDRIQDLVMNLKNFSRLDESTYKPVDLNQSMESTLKIANHLLKSDVEIVRDYTAGLPAVSGYPAQLNQVFLNLITNAAQALPSTGGRITLRTRRDGDHAEVRVSDNGSGISPENLKKIFEPFFTTKEVGKGTGLGLSIVYKIIEKHKGSIRAESTPGRGTEFIITLPLAESASQKPVAAASSPFTDSPFADSPFSR